VTSLRPYTYVTLAIEPDSAPRLGVSFYTSDLHVSAGTLDKPRPYLELSSDQARVSVSTSGGGPVTDADLTTAREIFNAAARYLADCERLHTGQSATGKAIDQTAA
jgi:hypothetical protein